MALIQSKQSPTAEEIEKVMDTLVEQTGGNEARLTGGLITCDGNCHKSIEQGGAKPCDCDCCKLHK